MDIPSRTHSVPETCAVVATDATPHDEFHVLRAQSSGDVAQDSSNKN